MSLKFNHRPRAFRNYRNAGAPYNGDSVWCTSVKEERCASRGCHRTASGAPDARHSVINPLCWIASTCEGVIECPNDGRCARDCYMLLHKAFQQPCV
eukprot:3219986-Rhodomonas_salina.2